MAKHNVPRTDAIVVGSGPNGLAAAIRLAQAGRSVVVLEAASTPGGGVRSAELTLPGFIHDICSSVYPLAVCSPFLSTLPLKERGLEWIFPATALAHPFDDRPPALLYSSLDKTAATLGSDAGAYRRLFRLLIPKFEDLLGDVLAPPHLPLRPFLMAQFGLKAIRSARSLATELFHTEAGRGFFAGMAAHSILPLESPSSAAVALVLGCAGHAAGWPIVRGGSQRFTDALVSYLESIGGQVITNCNVESLEDLPRESVVLLDVTPRQLLKMSTSVPAIPPALASRWGRYRRRLENFRYGPAAYKIDWALSRPIPWRDAECGTAGTVHLGATLDEISESERLPVDGQVAARPFVLLAQPTLFDPSRAPDGRHTAWGYCHVPNSFNGDVTDRIERQVERFAPGFRDCILARSVVKPLELEKHNSSLVGGDIAGGAMNLDQLFLRPTGSLYSTPLKNLYICSSSTPPGPGVHGMCGFWAAERALRNIHG